MFDALQALTADRDRVCVVASFLPGDRVWGKKKTVRLDAGADDVGQLVFDATEVLPPAEAIRRLRALPPVPDEGANWEPEEAELL